MVDADDDLTPVADTSSHQVVAVCVSHDGSQWLPRVLDAIAAQSRRPDRLIVVDTGSTDGADDVARRHASVDQLVEAPRRTSFGGAVGLAVQGPDRTTGPGPHWYWLLHDDAAPATDALEHLLIEAARSPDAGVVGPKLREWPSLKRLQEVGVTLTGTGRVWTGLEPGEPDQGQHDSPRDVLAVSSAGMLVRREVWEELRGFDRRIPFIGDDVDFGWRVNRAGHRVRTAPDAVVFHVEALSRGLRSHAGGRRPRRMRRAASLRTLVANASVLGAVWQYVRLLLGSLLRCLGLLLAKAPREASDELRGAATFYLHPLRLLSARRARARTNNVSPREVRALLPSPLLPYRHGVDAVLEVARVYLAPRTPERSSGRRVAGTDTGPVDEEAENLPPDRTPLELVRRRPLLATFLAVLVVTVVASRSVLGGGPLEGGALLPVPDTVVDWWRAYAEPWHQVGLGSEDMLGPYVLALLIGAIVALGQTWLVVDLLFLAGPALAVLTAHRLAAAVVTSTRVRLWWAITYGLAVVATGAVAQGRIGTVVGAVIAPLVVRTAVTSLATDQPMAWWQRGVRLGLTLGLLTAFVPAVYPMAAVLLAAALIYRRGRSWPAVLVGLVVPWLVLGPWMWERVLSPSLVWWEAGRLDAGVGSLDPGVVDLVLGQPGGPGGLPIWFGAGLVLAGLAAWLRRDRRAEVIWAWLVGLLGLVAAALVAGRSVEAFPDGPSVSVWLGFPLLVWIAALAFAGALAADGAGDQLVARAFGWRQSVLAVTAALALLAPLLWGAAWLVRGSADPLRRDGATPVPSYLTARAETAEGPAVLLLGTDETSGQTTYAVLRGSGPRLGDEAAQPESSEVAAFGAEIARLVSNPDSETLTSLADHGIGSVVLDAGADPDVAVTLDRAPGLQSTGTTAAGVQAWTVTVPAGYARAVPGRRAPPEAATVLPAGSAVPFEVRVESDGLLVLTARESAAWQATQGGSSLTPIAVGDNRQAFELADGGVVRVDYESRRMVWVLVQLGAVLIVVVMAAPGRRRVS